MEERWVRMWRSGGLGCGGEVGYNVEERWVRMWRRGGLGCGGEVG